MEFSFGDEYKDGPLALGMHKRGSFHDIVNVQECRIVDEDFRKILSCTLEYAKNSGLPTIIGCVTRDSTGIYWSERP